MSEYLIINGGKALNGKVNISGAKNAALPQLIATLLTPEKCVIRRVPNLEDVNLTLHLLQTFGSIFEYHNSTINITSPKLLATEASYSLVKSLRASFWVLAPLLARGRAARVSLPGGDIIGARPVDIHLEALTKMGADIQVKHGIVYATASSGLKAANIDFRFPSVGATHQILMAAALTPGTTVINGAAKEPEVIALAQMLVKMGASIEGEGTSQLIIHGREELGGVELDLIGDRIEAGTYLLAGLASKGCITVSGIEAKFFKTFLDVLEVMGAEVVVNGDEITAKAKNGLQSTTVVTGPFPEFPTDLQAPIMAALCTANGESCIEEHIFEGRFGNVSELCRMGAKIRVDERTAYITGISHLSGATVEGRDIRAAASLVIAGLGAEGVTHLQEIQHLRRGYDNMVAKLNGLGASVKIASENIEDYFSVGC